MNKNLSLKIIIPVVTVIIISFAGSTATGLLLSKAAVESAKYQHMDASLSSISSQMDNTISEVAQTLNSWVALLGFDLLLSNPDDSQIATESLRRLETISSRFPGFETIILRDDSGRAVMSSDPRYLNNSYLGSFAYFESAMSGKTSVSFVQRSLISDNPVFAIAIPVRQKGSVVGTIEAAYNLSHSLLSVFNQTQVGQDSFSIALDNSLRYISHPDLDKIQRGTVKLKDVTISDFKADHGILEYIDETGDSRILKYQRNEITDWILAISIPKSVLFAAVYQLSLLNSVISILCVVLVSASGIFIIGKHINPLIRVSDMMEIFGSGQGDLSIEIPVTTRDEIGKLITNFNNFVLQQRQIISTIQWTSESSTKTGAKINGDIENVLNASEEIANKTAEMERHMAHQKEAQTQVQNSIEAIRSSISVLDKELIEQGAERNATSESVDRILKSMANMTSLMESRQNSVKSFHENASAGANRQKEAESFISDILDLSDSIKGVTQLIKGISNKTNLLSMNAAIEAAHAGDAGRGFSIVADEIRKLAEDATKNSKEIDNFLSSIVNKISQSSQLMNQNTSIFEGISRESSEMVDFFNDLQTSIGELSGQGENINESVQSLQRSSGEVENTEAIIVERSEAIAKLVSGTSAIAETLFQGTVLINGQTSDINGSLRDISRIFDALHNRYEELASAVRQFKTSGEQTPTAASAPADIHSPATPRDKEHDSANQEKNADGE